MVKAKVEKKVKGRLEKKKLKNWASMSRTPPWMMGTFFVIFVPLEDVQEGGAMAQKRLRKRLNSFQLCIENLFCSLCFFL
jgi:hypothetical protein